MSAIDFMVGVGQMLPRPVKQLIYWAVAWLPFLYRNVVQTPDGQVFDVPKPMRPVDFWMLRAGKYEAPEISTIREFFAPEQGTIIEIGAHIGIVGRYAIAEKLLDGGTYIAVEPNPASHAALERNMARAGQKYTGRTIRIVKKAVDEPSREGQEATFNVRPGLGSGLATLRKRCAREVTIPVPLTSLSTLVAESPSPSISLICDAEGGEIPIITQDAAALSQIRQIAVELHGTESTGSPVSPDMMIAELKRQGFKHGGCIHHTHYFSRQPN